MTSRLFVIALFVFGSAAVPAMAQNSGSSTSAQTKVEHYQDWDVRCGAGAEGSTTQCEMTQLVNQKNSKHPIMRIAIGYPPNTDKPVAIFLLPLGVRLPQGVQLSVDGDSPRSFPVQLCVKQGCRADLPLKDSLVNKLRGGSKASVTIHDPRGQEVDLPVSLIGFSAAFKRISP